MRQSDYYSYRIVWSEEDREFVGLCSEFPSLSWLAESKEAALQGISRLVCEVIEDLESAGEAIPEPFVLRSFSGKFQVRVPPELHRDLTLQAADAGVSLNRLINAKLGHS